MKASIEEDSKPSRVTELYSMHKTMKQSQQLNFEKKEEDREKIEMSYCTFMPKTTKLQRKIFYKRRNDLYDSSNEFYVKKKKKMRDDKKSEELKKKEMSDKRMRITVPKEFRITSEKSNAMKEEYNNINFLCQYNNENGIRINTKMNYYEAIKLLHTELLNTNQSEDSKTNES